MIGLGITSTIHICHIIRLEDDSTSAHHGCFSSAVRNVSGKHCRWSLANNSHVSWELFVDGSFCFTRFLIYGVLMRSIARWYLLMICVHISVDHHATQMCVSWNSRPFLLKRVAGFTLKILIVWATTTAQLCVFYVLVASTFFNLSFRCRNFVTR